MPRVDRFSDAVARNAQAVLVPLGAEAPSRGCRRPRRAGAAGLIYIRRLAAARAAIKKLLSLGLPDSESIRQFASRAGFDFRAMAATRPATIHDAAPTPVGTAQRAAARRLRHVPLVIGGLVLRERGPLTPESKRAHRRWQTQPARAQQADGDD